MKKISMLAVFALFALTSTAQTTAITNAEIHTVSGPPISDGTIVLQNGLIVAVGANISVPAGAKVIDGTGKIITPGFMDSGSQIGLTEIGLSAQGTVDGTTTEKDFGGSFNPVWAVNPDNTYIPITRLRGVTSTVVVPGGNQLFTGQGSVIALDGELVSDMLRSESMAVYTAMGEAGSSRAGGSRAANYQRIYDALNAAREQMLSSDVEDTLKKTPPTSSERPELKKFNLDALQAVVSGDIPLVITANRVSDLQLALTLKDEFDLSLVINGGAEAWRIADALAAADVAVIVNATRDLPTFDGLSATLGNAGRLQAAGVEVLLTGGRGLSHRAGLAVANGMDHSAALRAVTLGPATVWGLDESMGSLEAGKIADIVVWSGDPFELSTSVEHVFIGGREIPDDSRHERLFDRYKDLGRYRTIGR